MLTRELTVRVEATDPLPARVRADKKALDPFRVLTVRVEPKEPLLPSSVETVRVEPMLAPELTNRVEPVRVEKERGPDTERDETRAVELTVRVFTMLEATVKVEVSVKVEADRLLSAKLLVHNCRPLVLTVNTYPVLTKDPSGL